MTRVPIKVEIGVDGTWTDVSADVRTEVGITITRGRRDEQVTRSDPSSCALHFKNDDGKYSPRNPRSAYFGKIGRNTPLRVSASLGKSRMWGASGTGGISSTPDSAGLSITGDLDVRWDGYMPRWDANSVLLAKYVTAGNQRSYRLYCDSTGKLVFSWSTAGTVELTATSTVVVLPGAGRRAVRATIDVDNGASGRTITFYTSDTINGTWVPLGDPVVQAGTTSIFDSTAVLQVNALLGWEIYGAEVRQGIGGTVRANPDFTAQTSGATSFSDGINTWTMTAELSNRRVRFVGEIPSWPAEWSAKSPVWAGPPGAGILRRLGQGTQKTFSALTYGIPGVASALVGYWPMEDEVGSASLASWFAGNPPMTFDGSPALAAASPFIASKALPKMGTSAFTLNVPPNRNGVLTLGTQGTLRFLISLPAAGTSDGAIVARAVFGGGFYADIIYSTFGGGSFTATSFTSLGSAINTTDTLVGLNGKTLLVGLDFNTATSEWRMRILEPNALVATVTATIADTFGNRILAAAFNVTRNLGDTVIGHAFVQDSNPDIFEVGYPPSNPLNGYAGETSGLRFSRVAFELGVSYSIAGYVADTALIGTQKVGTFLDNIDDALDVDLGMIYEPRSANQIRYRVRSSLENQAPALTVPYADLLALTPDPDDLTVRNDITLVREGGSSTRAQQATGAMSILDPPNGVGPYAEQVTANLYTDAQLPDQASWRLHMGTVDETRYPVLGLDLLSPAFRASTAQQSAALLVDLGDLVAVTALPAWLPPDQVDQIVQGYAETFSDWTYELSLNVSPASPYDIGVYDYAPPTVPTSRYAPNASTLNAAISSTATGAAALSLVTPAGEPLWTTAAGDFPLNIRLDGEVITLSAIAATASPQAATVSARGVNGYARAHAAGVPVDIADPVYYAL